MERSQAIYIIGEILDKSTALDDEFISLVSPDSTSKLSDGYHIYLLDIDTVARQSIESILKKYNLAIFENVQSKLSIIFKPQDII